LLKLLKIKVILHSSSKAGTIVFNLKAKLNFKQAMKVVLASAGSILFVAPSLLACELTKTSFVVPESLTYSQKTLRHQSPDSVAVPISIPVKIAYEYDACPRNTYVLRYGETSNYNVWICATEGGTLYYVGQAKNPDRGGIVLPIRSYSGERYIAVNGNTRYTVTPSRLLVTQGRRTILNERIFQWQQGSGQQG
jgi:hypothetical protein